MGFLNPALPWPLAVQVCRHARCLVLLRGGLRRWRNVPFVFFFMMMMVMMMMN